VTTEQESALKTTSAIDKADDVEKHSENLRIHRPRVGDRPHTNPRWKVTGGKSLSAERPPGACRRASYHVLLLAKRRAGARYKECVDRPMWRHFYIKCEGNPLWYAWKGIVPLRNVALALRDLTARVMVLRRIDRIAAGNFGDHKYCRDGVWELQIDFGPGYRVYYGRAGKTLILLLGAGSKRSQASDIERLLNMDGLSTEAEMVVKLNRRRRATMRRQRSKV
jgi:putative addiction module killer protein